MGLCNETPPKLTAYSQRCKDAKEVLKSKPTITPLNEHSLGGAVVMQLHKEMPERNFTVTTYGAPTISKTPASEHTQRYRTLGDPISILDRGTRKTDQSQGSRNPLTAPSFARFDHTSDTSNNGWAYNDTFQPRPQYNAPMAPTAIPQTQHDNEWWVMSAKAE